MMSKSATTTTSRLDELLKTLEQTSPARTMRGWNDMVEEVSGQLPAEVAAAFLSGRPELIKLAPARELNAEQTKALLFLVAALIATNRALQIHAEQVAQLVKNFGGGASAMMAAARQIDAFANFRPIEEVAQHEASTDPS